MKQLTTLEIFSGTKSFSKVMEAHGHITHTVDIDPRLNPDEVADIRKWEPVFVNACDILWASPPCQGFSVAVIGRNWNHDYTPKTDSARLSMELAQVTLDLIEEIRPKWWFIENPRAMLRKMPWMEEFLWKHGGGPTYRYLLQIRRHAHEADRHLDERSLVEAAPTLREWRYVSRISTTRIAYRNTRYQRSARQRSDPAGNFRGDTRADAGYPQRPVAN